MSQTTDPAGTRRGRGGAPPIEGRGTTRFAARLRRSGDGGVEIPAVDVTHEQLQRELDATRLAVGSLLAVTSDEQFSAVEKALMAVAPMSEISQAALEELRTARRQQLAGEEAAKAPKSSRL